MTKPSRSTVKQWMLRHVQSSEGGHLIDRRSGEINATLLAENAAHAFDHDEWLDDETHYVWELALEIDTI